MENVKIGGFERFNQQYTWLHVFSSNYCALYFLVVVEYHKARISDGGRLMHKFIKCKNVAAIRKLMTAFLDFITLLC